VEQGERSNGMMDATAFLAFNTRLKDLRDRVDAAKVSGEQRARWQRKLIAVSDAGARDLDRATTQLSRFEAEVDRSLGR
jgi:phytoene/squalene synthetase